MSKGLVKTFTSYGALFVIVQLIAAWGPSADSGNNAAPVTQQVNMTGGNAAPSPTAIAEGTQLVVAFGDSLFAGYQLGADEGFAPALERALTKSGTPARVFNAGVSGDTSAAGRRRLAFVLDGLPRKPDLVVVGLGGNDMLRGVDPRETRANLTAIMEELKRREIDTVLAGMVAAPNMGAEFAGTFNPIYSDLARRYDAPLYPFLLDGVIGNRKLLLPDGVHPNPQGVDIIVAGIAPVIAKALDR